MDYSLLGSSVHRISQARILEWVAISSSRGSSQPRDQTHVSCVSSIGRRVLYHQRHLQALLVQKFRNHPKLQPHLLWKPLHLPRCLFVWRIPSIWPPGVLSPFMVCNMMFGAAAAKLLQSCPTLCDPIDGSLPGSPVPGILQERTLEWVAISFSNAWKWKVKVKSLTHVRLFATPWTAAYQASPSMGFSRQEYWSGVPSPSPIWCLVVLDLCQPQGFSSLEQEPCLNFILNLPVVLRSSVCKFFLYRSR